MRIDRQQHTVAIDHAPRMREINAGEIDVLAGDVLPDVQLGPVGKRKDADMLAGPDPAVQQPPQLGPLQLGIPLTELVAEGEYSLLRAGLFFVAPRSAKGAV